jgi:hypothetical protein
MSNDSPLATPLILSQAPTSLTRKPHTLRALTTLAAWSWCASAAIAQCPFNASGAAVANATNDGMLLLRAAQGLRDSALTATTQSALSATNIISNLAANEARIDINGSGAFDETDAAIIVRHLLGFREGAMIPGGAGGGATRKNATDIQGFIDSGCVAPSPTRKKLSQMPRSNGGVFISILDDVEIDQDATLEWLEIQGSLVCTDRDLNLTAKWIIIHGGNFQCGSALNPFNKQLTITLAGPKSEEVALGAGMGTKVLGAMHVGAQLRLFGEDRKGWTQLAANAAIGATSITLKEAVPSWRAGDRLIIAPSSFDAEDYDLVTISSVTGNTVNFTPALRFEHWGTLQTFDGKTLDQRAAVGLLSRNIVVQGDAQSDAQAFGGHIMSMLNASVQLSGVELRKMGQRGKFGRYPMHWHIANDRPHDFIRNSSIHSSFQRAVVLHQTNQVTVEGNVAFDITNHAFVWAEDGLERDNKFLRNLAVLNKSPIEADFAFHTPNNPVAGNSTQSEFRSASFWGRSFKHTIVGNIAGGSVDGFGFFFDRFSPSTLGDDEQSALVFEDNVAHSNYRPEASGVAGEIYPEATFGHGLMVTSGLLLSTDHVFSRFTSYKNYGGAWLEDRVTRLKDSILADNGVGTYILRGVIDNVSFINKSANTLGNAELPPKGGFAPARRAAIVVPSSHGGARAPVILDARVLGYTGAEEFAFVNDQNDVAYSDRVEKLTMTPPGNRFGMNEGIPIEYSFTDNGINDGKGQLSGDGVPTAWASRRSPMVNGNCRADLVVYHFACPQSRLVRFVYENPHARTIWLVEDSGETHGLGQAWTFDNALPWVSASWLKNGARYEMVRLENAGSSELQFLIDSGAPASAELTLRASSAPSTFSINGSNVGANSSLAALRASAATGYFYDPASQRTHLKLAGSGTQQRIRITAAWAITPASSVGRASSAGPYTPGFHVDVYNTAQGDVLRQALPTGAVATSTSSNNAQLIGTSTTGFVPSNIGTTTVFRGFIQVANDGLYQVSAPAVGGHIDMYVDNVWVTGSRTNDYPVQNDPDPTYLGEGGKIWLKAGWHPVKLVFGRNNALANYAQPSKVWLRMAPIDASTFPYVNIYRTP